MATETRRVIRMLLKAVLLITLPLTGFVWALPNGSTMMTYAAALTLLSVAVGVGAELLAATNEAELKDATAQYEAQSRRRAEELELRDEKLRQFDRIAALLTEQNHSLRAKLIAVQVDVLRQKEGLQVSESDIKAQEDLAQARRIAGGNRGS